MFVLDVTVPDLAVGIDAAGAGVVAVTGADAAAAAAAVIGAAAVTGAGVSPCDLTVFMH